MPTTGCATDISLTGLQSEDGQTDAVERLSAKTSKPLKSLLIGFAATVAVGLGLAVWYVSNRIVSANEVAASNAPAAAIRIAPVPKPVEPLSNAVAQDSMAEAYWYTVPPANYFLQVAGLGSKQDAGFVTSLEARGFRARVQMRDGDDTRVLIGPFATHVEMEQGQRKLQSTGVLAIETTY